jgi:hypothetical protein
MAAGVKAGPINYLESFKASRWLQSIYNHRGASFCVYPFWSFRVHPDFMEDADAHPLSFHSLAEFARISASCLISQAIS